MEDHSPCTWPKLHTHKVTAPQVTAQRPSGQLMYSSHCQKEKQRPGAEGQAQVTECHVKAKMKTMLSSSMAPVWSPFLPSQSHMGPMLGPIPRACLWPTGSFLYLGMICKSQASPSHSEDIAPTGWSPHKCPHTPARP